MDALPTTCNHPTSAPLLRIKSAGLRTVAATAGSAGGILLPFAGSALVAYIIGFALKKIVKWVMIILGVLAGIVFMVIQRMSQNGYIRGPVEWDKLGNDAASYGQHLVATTNIHQCLPLPRHTNDVRTWYWFTCRVH